MELFHSAVTVRHEAHHLPSSNATSHTLIPHMLSKNGAKLNTKTTFHLKFEVLSLVLLKIEVFLDVTLCGWVSSSNILKAL
jgi:hypothetical protein